MKSAGSSMSHQTPATPGVEQRAVVVAPPGARVGVREVGERAHARPDRVAVLVAVDRLAEQAALAPLGVDRIALVDLHARVDDRDRPEALLGELGDQPGRVGVALGVPGEDAVAVHVLDVEVEAVAGDVALAELARQPEDLLGAGVAPARLVVAERPQRRQRHAPGQLRVAGEHVARRGAGEDVGDHVAARRLVADALRVGLGEVDLDAVRVVEEDAVRPPVAQREHERDRRVEVVLRGAVAARRVDVPEHLPRPGLLEPARPLAAAEEARVRGPQVVHPHRRPDQRRRGRGRARRSTGARRPPAPSRRGRRTRRAAARA